MAQCKVGEILRDGFCKAKPGMADDKVGSLCNIDARGRPRSESACNRKPFKDACTFIPEKCVPDQGKPGKTPLKGRVLPPMTGGIKLRTFMPGNKMPFNEKLDIIKTKCQDAGNKMQAQNVPERSAIGKTVLAFNWNERLKKFGAAEWNKQRTACLDGIRAAYDR